MNRKGQKFLYDGKTCVVVGSYQNSTFKGWSHELRADGDFYGYVTENKLQEEIENGNLVWIGNDHVDKHFEASVPNTTTACDHKWVPIYGITNKPLGWDCEHCGAKREDVEA